MPVQPVNPVLNQAVLHHRAGRFADAIPLYKQLLRRSPQSAQLLDLLGCAQNSVGEVEEGRKHIERAVRLSPSTASYHHDLSLTYKREGRFARSHECLDEAIRLAPGNATYSAAKAELHVLAGEFEAAQRAIEPVLDLAAQTPAVAIVFGAIAPRVKAQRRAIELLGRCLEAPGLQPAVRMKALFTLGALHDGIDEHELAFDAYRRGNELKAARFDTDEHRAAVSATIAAWTPEAIARVATPVNAASAKAAADGSNLIFIVGMPRSGTTLVEQILAAAPTIFAAGELNDMLAIARGLDGGRAGGVPILRTPARLTAKIASDAGATYLRAISRLRAGNRMVVDKMPLNFLNLGLIQVVLPGAKIIHCRRDAMDTCLSCYFQLFDGNLGFAYDLANVGRFHREYERLMAHWKAVLTLPILDVQYEALIADQAGVSQRLYEFVGLPWTDSALRFHESTRTSLTSSNAQVRQPIYNRSVQRHRQYERYLASLREALGG